MACKREVPLGQVDQVVGGVVASSCSLMMRRLLAIVLRKVPFINGSSNRIAPRRGYRSPAPVWCSPERRAPTSPECEA